MIPLRDINPRYSTPFVTIALIAANVLVFLYQMSLGPNQGRALILELGMVPARIPLAFGRPDVTLSDAFLPLFSSMFLHGGILHVLGNVWFLWVFGDNVEDRLGHFRYLLFYVACGIGAGLAHSLVDIYSTIPAIGASGAVSGIMGAYFVLFPNSRVVTLIPLVFIWFTMQIRAVFILGYWLAIQVFSGLLGAEGVAWWAHVGGFLLGFVLAKQVRSRRTLYFGD